MSYKLSNIEKETIIIFNESEQTANITTYNNKLINKLDSLYGSRSDDIILHSIDSTGCRDYTVPKKMD